MEERGEGGKEGEGGGKDGRGRERWMRKGRGRKDGGKKEGGRGRENVCIVPLPNKLQSTNQYNLGCPCTQLQSVQDSPSDTALAPEVNQNKKSSK